MFYENWENREFWQTHIANQHLADYMAATEGAVIEFTLNEYHQLAVFLKSITPLLWVTCE
jgi:quinol monooxygenase YgiN